MKEVAQLIASWQAARAELAAIERAEHPDITDHHGRVWTWRGRGDLYRHCSLAWPEEFVRNNRHGLPTQAALDSPNYDLCDLCLGGRTRNVPDCKPEWNCTHTMHQGTDGGA